MVQGKVKRSEKPNREAILPERAVRLPGFTINEMNRLPVNIQCLPLLRPLCLLSTEIRDD